MSCQAVPSADRSVVDIHHLEDDRTQTCLFNFHELIASCRGPYGCIKMIQNNVGGHLSMTSKSSRLLETMSLSHPVLKLIASCAQSQLNKFQDGGLLTCQLCLDLILSALKMEKSGLRCVSEIYELCFLKLEDYLKSTSCATRFTVDIGTMTEVFDYIGCILRSKPLCGLHIDKVARHHISNIVLKSFLHSIPDDASTSWKSDKILIHSSCNGSLCDSLFLNGVLIECPMLSSSFKQLLDIKRLFNGTGGSAVRVMLVNVSMSGDGEEVLDIHCEHGSDFNMTTVTELALMDTCSRAVDCGIGLLLAQKVVHPKLKAFLRQQQVLVVDRIGAASMPYLQDITGGCFISSVLSGDVDESLLGSVENLDHLILNGKSYLHLENSAKSVVSLLLSASIEEVLHELKGVCGTALASLQRLVQDNSVLCGGGCWQMEAGSSLEAKLLEEDLAIMKKYPRSKVMQVVGEFCKCLRHTATSMGNVRDRDRKHDHVWRTLDDGTHTCSCGLYSVDRQNGELSQPIGDILVGTRPLVVDNLSAALGAVHTAVYTANSILTTSQFIHTF